MTTSFARLGEGCEGMASRGAVSAHSVPLMTGRRSSRGAGPFLGDEGVTEAQLHTAIAQYLAHSLHPRVWWSTFPLGSGGRVRGAQLKGRGARKGTPDILLIDLGLALWLEVKTVYGRLSKDQRLCHAQLIAAGSDVVVVRSVEDVEAALIARGVPLIARLAA